MFSKLRTFPFAVSGRMRPLSMSNGFPRAVLVLSEDENDLYFNVYDPMVRVPSQAIARGDSGNFTVFFRNSCVPKFQGDGNSYQLWLRNFGWFNDDIDSPTMSALYERGPAMSALYERVDETYIRKAFEELYCNLVINAGRRKDYEEWEFALSVKKL